MKRLNVKLALWLVGITVFSVVGVHFLHGFQLNRNAESLQVQAKNAEAAGNTQEAIKLYNQFLRHRDDRDGYAALAKLVVEVAKEADATNQDKLRAYNILEEAIRRHRDLDDVRLSLVDYTMAMRRYGDALEHIGILRANGNKSPELDLKIAQCMFLNGDEDKAKEKLLQITAYDEAADTFAESAPASAQEVEAFVLLSHILRKSGDVARADHVMKQMVEWNPDSAEAHLARARDILGTWSQTRVDTPEGKDLRDQLFADSKEELKRAYELDGDNADVMLLMAASTILEKDFAQAQSILDRALEKHPERPDVYLRRAELAMTQDDAEKAAEELKAGLKKASSKSPLLQQLVEIQLKLQKLDDAAETCDEMRKVESIPLEFVRYQEARIKLGQNKVVEATREFEQVRPAMERLGGQYLGTINSLLGRCYESLGMADRQLEVYRRILATYPSMTVAHLGEASALQALGRHSEAATSIALLAKTAQQADPQLRPLILQLALNQETAKPQSERNFEQVNNVATVLFADESIPQLRRQLLKADLLVAQGETDEALQMLSALRKENPKDIGVWAAICRMMSSSEKYRDRIPQLLTLAEKEVGDEPALHAERIKLATREGGEKAVEELHRLEKQIDQYDEAQQPGLRSLLAVSYLQVGDYEDGKRCLRSFLATMPTNARTQQLLFELAVQHGDEPEMQERVKELKGLKSFGPESALYKYCAAELRLYQFRTARKDSKEPLTAAERDELADIRKLVDEGIAIRAEWASLWRLKGELDQLDGDIDGAIANYQRSLDYSRANQTATARRLVTLLSATQRYTEANEAMKYLSGTDLPEEMRKLVELTKIRGGNAKEALEMARIDVTNDPQNASKHLWYGQLLDDSGEGDTALESYRQAVELDPKLIPAWELLVRRLMANGKNDQASAAVAEASKSLGDIPLAMGRLYQRVGELDKAAELYEEAITKDPKSLLARRHAAEFYLARKDADAAIKHLDAIIDLGSKSEDQGDAQQVAWARTRKAQNMAPVWDYQHTMDAIKLIEQNANDGELSREDTLTIIALLAPRVNEAPSRQKAIKLLEKLRRTDGLSDGQMMTLGQLYYRDGNWEEARAQMLAAIASHNNDLQALALFAGMLIEHDQLDDAVRYVDRAEEVVARGGQDEIAQYALGVRMLRAQLLAKQGKKEEAAQLLESLVPRPLSQGQLGLLVRVGQQLEQLELYDAAEKMFQEYAEHNPKTGPIELAGFYGRRGDIERSFAILEKARESQPMTVIMPVALADLRNFPDKITVEQLQTLDRWGQSAIKTSDNPRQLKMMLAELYDLQGHYDEVESIYRDLLSDPETTSFQKSVVRNNLAFVLAAIKPSAQRGAESQKLIEEAMKILGPTPELLDTRALAFLAQGKAEEAAADLRMAIGELPTTSTYYHLAQVEKQLGNEEAARSAIEKAQELHGERNQFTPAEREGFRKLKSELDLTTQAGT